MAVIWGGQHSAHLNPVEVNEALQHVDESTLERYLKTPPPGIMPYQVASEVKRRVASRERDAALRAKMNQRAGTVVQDAMNALNPGSFNPVPANPSQLAALRTPSDITGPNAPTSPPLSSPPINTGIASGMQQQPALSPPPMSAAQQPMQAAGGTMGRTVYAKHGGVPSGSVYNRGSDALEKAREMARKEGRLYSKERSRPFEGDLKNPYPEQELKRRAMLALLTSPAVAEKNRAYGGMGASAFASNGTQGRTVYAQSGYPPKKVSEAPPGVVSLTRVQLEEARNMGVGSVERYHAEIARRQRAADLSREHGAALSKVEYPALEGTSTGAELLAKRGTRKEMIGVGVDPDSPGAVTALANAKRDELDATRAYKEAQAERGILGGELGFAFTEAQATQREGEQLEARRAEKARVQNLVDEKAGRMTTEGMSPPSLETGSNASWFPPITPGSISGVRQMSKTGSASIEPPRSQLKDVPPIEEAVKAVNRNRTEVGLTDRAGRSIMPPEEAFQYLDEQPNAMVRSHVGKAINDYFVGLPLGVYEKNIKIKSDLLKSLEEGAPPQEVLQEFELAKGGILKSTEDYTAKIMQTMGGNPQLREGPLNKVRFLNKKFSPGSVVNAFYDAQIASLEGLELAPAHDAYTGGAGSGVVARKRAKEQEEPPPRTVSKNGILSEVEEPPFSTVADPDLDEGYATGMAPTVPESGADADAREGFASGVVPEVAPGDGAGGDAHTEALAKRTKAETERGTIKFLDAVDSDKIRSDTYDALSEDSKEAFKRIEAQFDTLKDYDPRQSIKDIQAGRASRIKQIKSDTNIQRLLTASAAFLGTTTFYEGFGKAMEGMTDLSKEEQKQVLALQDKIDESDLTARFAYVEHQAKMASMENNLLAAKRADQRGNSEEASRRAALAVAERAAANDLLYKAEQLTNARMGYEIQRLAYTYEKRTDTERAMDSFIKNQWKVLTPEQKVAFGWPEGATNIGQLDFSKASSEIKKYLDDIGLGKSASYAGSNFVIGQAQRAQDTLIAIEKTGSDLFGDITSSRNTIPLDDLQTFVTALGNVDTRFAGMELPRQGKSNFLSPGKVTEKGKASGYKRAIELWAARKRLSQTSLRNERNAILGAYPELDDLDAWLREQAANEGGGAGGEGGATKPPEGESIENYNR